MAVHLSIFERTNRRYGQAIQGGAISHLLERAQPDFGTALLQVHIELVCRAPSLIDTPVRADEMVMGAGIGILPKNKLSLKSKRYELTVLSQRPGDDPVPMLTGAPSFSQVDFQREIAAQQAAQAERQAEFARRRADVARLSRLFDEVADVLAAHPPKIKASAFDWHGFVGWFKSLRTDLPDTLQGIEAAERSAHAAFKARIEATDPWARLDIDWRGFHPDARKLLPDPFYWSGSDDLAPHGNDEGSDVLAEMRKRPRKAEFTEDTFAALADHFEHASEGDIANWADYERTRYLDFVVAVAFGHLKLKGCCPIWLRDKALIAMRREIATLEMLIERDKSGVPLSTWDAATAPHRTPKQESLKRFTALLEHVPHSPSQ